MADQNPPHHMPLSRECIAPRFDSSKPREIHKFWEDIESHFEHSGIMDNERKPWVLQYVDLTLATSGKSLKKLAQTRKHMKNSKPRSTSIIPEWMVLANIRLRSSLPILIKLYPTVYGTRTSTPPSLMVLCRRMSSHGFC